MCGRGTAHHDMDGSDKFFLVASALLLLLILVGVLLSLL
jgi:hypothetical protein